VGLTPPSEWTQSIRRPACLFVKLAIGSLHFQASHSNTGSVLVNVLRFLDAVSCAQGTPDNAGKESSPTVFGSFPVNGSNRLVTRSVPCGGPVST